MSIHSGHPEKYQPISQMIKDIEVDAEGKLALDSELRIDAARLSEAWLPIDQQRQVFTQFQTAVESSNLPEEKKEKETDLSNYIPKGITNIGNTCYLGSFL